MVEIRFRRAGLLQELIDENIFLRDENRRLNDELSKLYAEQENEE